MPRRTSPENSVTLQHHRLAREASRKAFALKANAPPVTSSPRRNSSGESHVTTHSDPKKWFDRSNRNATGNFDAGSMDVDPPFFQKETDSSNEERRGPGNSSQNTPYLQGTRPGVFRRTTQSSSADDYRSVIDDLTIENKRLKEELKRYKQFGPDMMKKEKLFEIKIHGLSGWKKRELEATLRDFAAGLDGEAQSRESPPQRMKSGRHAKNMYSSGESRSKHASSSSSHSRPVDSAYHSMSTGQSSNAPQSSTGQSLGRPSVGSRTKSSQQKVEHYLRDTPDGLFPRHMVMTDKDKKKLVVRRLEQLFTGKITGKNLHRNQSMPSMDVLATSELAGMALPRAREAAREAYIQQQDVAQKKPPFRDNGSTSNGDQTETGGNGMGSGSGGRSGGLSGSNPSPPCVALPEQRPTRPLDLDPDRVQIPSENMKYIQHLGVVPAEFLVDKKVKYQDVSPDADGWVYLNLLCNLAQLHMINVTPSFIRSAVSEKSTKFQLSPDGRKIRWRGGTDGTKFSSDSSADNNSQKSPSADDTEGSNESSPRKRARTLKSEGATASGRSSDETKFGPQLSHSSSSFHYKPLFVRHSSTMESSLEGTVSQASDGGADDSNPDQSKWDYSGSGSSKRKKHRRDGAIIYYNGAPFCTDLSGDPGGASPTTYLTSTGQELDSVQSLPRFLVHRSLSGSSLPIRPLSDERSIVAEVLDIDLQNPPDLVDDDEDTPNEDEIVFPWCDEPEKVQLRPIEPLLEPCGLGGVLPEDHFAVIVTTRRTIASNVACRLMLEDTPEVIASRLASMRTSSPLPPRSTSVAALPIEIEYLGGKIHRLNPVPLPPPATFFPPFSTDSDSDDDDEDEDSYDEDMSYQDSISEGLISQRANPRPENEDSLSSESDGNAVRDGGGRLSESEESISRRVGSGSVGSAGKGLEMVHTGSSVATAGGAESGYNSSMEDDAQ
ncbi:frequency clock protein [Apodospora peruviana]|uniref:Frequency clock protein n=1 Tax=Apodospora peruviana TaxID=516989 RepID=A0AAE0IAI2_9PEZI|nr:frequency clock protein [Apodospora peruviana]